MNDCDWVLFIILIIKINFNSYRYNWIAKTTIIWSSTCYRRLRRKKKCWKKAIDPCPHSLPPDFLPLPPVEHQRRSVGRQHLRLLWWGLRWGSVEGRCCGGRGFSSLRVGVVFKIFSLIFFKNFLDYNIMS